MKRICVIAFALLLTFFAVSCAETSESESFDIEMGVISDKIDLNGFECPIVQAYDESIVLHYPQDTLLSDAVLKRMSDIGNEWNCNISIVSGSEDHLRPEITKILANVYIGEMGYSHCAFLMANAGCFCDLSAFSDSIDLKDTKKYGSLGVREAGIVNGVSYAVSPALWAGKEMTFTYNIFAVNESIIKKYGLTDPRDYVENGEWTWDGFYNHLPEYQITDGEITYTAANITWHFVGDIAMNNGATLTKQNDNGEYVPNLDSENWVQSLDWCTKLFTERADCIEYLGHYSMIDAFNNQEIVLAHTSFSHMIESIIYETEDYGVVPLPCGPLGEYGKWCGLMSGYDSIGIFINAKEPEIDAMIINRLFEPLDGYETEEARYAYASTIFYDSRDCDLFMNYLNYVRWDYHQVSFKFWDEAKEYCKVGKSSSEILGKLLDRYNGMIEEYLIPNDRYFAEMAE